MEHLINLVSRQKQSNLSIVANFLLEHFGAKFTATQLNKITGDNVGSASLLNLQETLSEYGIKSAGVWKGSLRYSEFQTPFVCSVQYESWSHAEFTVVTEADETSVTFLQPKTKEFQTVSLLEFAKIDNDVILLNLTMHRRNYESVFPNKVDILLKYSFLSTTFLKDSLIAEALYPSFENAIGFLSYNHRACLSDVFKLGVAVRQYGLQVWISAIDEITMKLRQPDIREDKSAYYWQQAYRGFSGKANLLAEDLEYWNSEEGKLQIFQIYTNVRESNS